MRYLFDDCILDTEQLSLKRQGQPVRLQPRVFQLLAYLLKHRQRVVARQELFDQVWQGQYVSKSALDGSIKQVRQAIGDSGRRQRLLKTQHGVGYRFVAPVTIEDTTVPEVDVTEPSAPKHGADTLPSVSVPERRQLTVLSCSVADAPYLVSQLDPDDLHAVLRAFHALCADTTAPYGGRVAQRLDGHCLIYFGYPQAHDDDARRAVLAGLKLLEAMRNGLPERGARMEGIGGLKIGIHTGDVVVDGDPSPDTLVVGAATMQASALRDLAAPQTLVISAQTARLVEGYVTRQALPPIVLPGQSDAVPVYRVTGASGARIRLDLVPAQRLTPFVGREAELALLGTRWVAARDGRGQAVIVRGEAGIGKSRLVRMLAEQRVPAGCAAVEGRASPYYQQSAFYPLGDVLHHVLHLDDCPGDAPVRRCEAMLQQYGMDVERHLPFVAPLLNLSLPPERYETSQLTPQQRRQRTFESLTALVLALTQQKPLLFILEDLHWVDPSTLEWLGMLLDQTPTAPLLLLMTCRPEFEVPWHSRSYLTQMTLDRLEVQHSRRMVKSLIRNSDLPVPVVQQIVEHSDGVPLFVEELTRAVLDTGLETQVPMTLQDTLTARLDQVGTAKRTAQLGAVMGRQFEDALIRAVSPLDDNVLQQDLHQLVDRELLYQQGVGPDATYRFKHALIQDAAYASLLRRSRQQLHGQIAQVLEVQFPEAKETHPELLARHYTEAGLADPAALWWQRAGKHAFDQSAFSETVEHLTKGVNLLQTLPETPTHMQREMDMQLLLGQSLGVVYDKTVPEWLRAYSRARTLCEQLGDTHKLFYALLGFAYYYQEQGASQQLQDTNDQLLSLAQDRQDPELLVRAHNMIGQTERRLGNLSSARHHIKQAIDIYDKQHRPSPSISHNTAESGYPIMSSLYHHAYILCALGYPDVIPAHIEKMRTHARDTPRDQGWFLWFAAALHAQRGDLEMARKRLDLLLPLVTEHAIVILRHFGMPLLGYIMTREGQGEAGIVLIRQVLASHPAKGHVRAGALDHLSRAYLHVNQPEAGLQVVAEAFELALAQGQNSRQSELHRRQGQLLLKRADSDTTQAEACFRQALDVARRQQAKFWELRAATNLARLWQSQDKHQAAYDLLAPVYGWFTEGFDTADLREARALLNKLSEGKA